MQDLKREDDKSTTNVKVSIKNKYIQTWLDLTHGSKSALLSQMLEVVLGLAQDDGVPIIPYILEGKKRWKITLST